MGLYLGTNKVKITMADGVYNMQLFSTTPIANGIRLLSSEGYVLQDVNGVYLIVEEV